MVAQEDQYVVPARWERIMVPLDGSATAERALPHAATLARSTGARLIITRTLPPRPVAGIPGAATARDPLLDSLTREAHTYLNRISRRLGNWGIPTESAVLYGEPAACIAGEAIARRADAIVIASHDGGTIGRSGYGGVAEALVARSPVPVVLTRVWRSASEGNHLARGSRLLVPLDGSLLAETALGPAAELARVLDGEVVLVRAVHGPVAEFFAAEMPASYEAGTLEAHKAEAHAYLATVADQLERDGTRCSTVVCVGEPVGVIGEVGAQAGAAMVVMATHGLSGARRTLTGSVAARVLGRDPLPVTLIGPEVAATAAMATA